MEKKKEEILPLLTKEDKEKEGTDEPQNFDLKPLHVELKYAYLEENNQCLGVYLFIAQCLTGKQSARSPQEEQTVYWVENF